MALEVPCDVPGSPFTRAGLITIDGDLFEGKRKIGTDVLVREIDYVRRNVTEDDIKTQWEWQQIRNVYLLWCLSYRAVMDDEAINSFLKYVGLTNFEVPRDSPEVIFNAIETNYHQSSAQVKSPAAWIKQRPPPQRLPTPSSLPPPASDRQQAYNSVPMYYTGTDPDTSSFIHTPKPVVDLNANPKYRGIYNFVDHRQEYDGFQFQCIFRCLKDGKHCRKAPVREMNRHLRDRHHFRQGFKIAGVDWEKKRWRGAGADHEECVGKIVAKDSADDSGDDSEGEYVVR